VTTEHDREIFRRHSAEGILLLGGGAAILLQLADPRVARGVAHHSDFATRPRDRLLGTLNYVYTIAFGDEDMVRHVVHRVNHRHAPVSGEAGATEASPAYSADDPDAQRWVASTLLAVALQVHERLVEPLPEFAADAIVRGYRPLGAQLRADTAGWPTSRAEFDEWWDTRLSQLHVTADARRVCRALFTPSGSWPRGAALAAPVLRLITASLLPPQLRADFGFRWTPRAARVTDGWLRSIGRVWPLLPRSIRHAPLRMSLRSVQRGMS